MTKFSISIRGKKREWCFRFEGNKKYWQGWLDDGLKIDEIVNIIPEWWVNLGFPVRVWCFLQDWLGI